MLEFLEDLWGFLKVRKRFWLLPLVVAIALTGTLTVIRPAPLPGSLIYVLF